MLEVVIDGKHIHVQEDVSILQAARQEGISIPTLCHHEALAGLGNCRLCVVEVDEGKGPKVVVSCVYPLKRASVVFTKSEKILRLRRGIISMLRDRAPEDPYLQSLCTEYSVPQTNRYELPPNLKCLLCGRCAAACAALGRGAISTMGRGTAKKVSTPYDRASTDCIGCGTCAQVCPVNAIACIETKDTRTIWNKQFRLIPCKNCGNPFTTKEVMDLAQEQTIPGLRETLRLCPDCRKKAPFSSANEPPRRKQRGITRRAAGRLVP